MRATAPREVGEKSPVTQGLRASLWWLGVELAFQWVLTGGLVFLLWPKVSADALTGESLALSWGVLAAAMLILFRSFQRRMRKEEFGAQEAGYYFSQTTLLLGLLAGIGLFLVANQTALLDNLLSKGGLEREAEKLVQAMRGMPPFTVYLLLPVNGLLAPVVEEYAWRGYIQTRLTQGWGPLWGLLVTAVLFAAKHIVVDLSLVRILTLLTIAFALGIIRHFWGTGASTVTHLALNSYASWVVITQALKQ